MDATAVLAICTKIGQVFQWKDSNLAHPLGFISYDPVEFDELTEPPGTFASLQNLSEFSRLVNLRPDGPIWSPEESTPLWDVVADIYSSADIADSVDDVALDAGLSMAPQSLSSEPSAADEKQRKYNQYLDRHELLLQRYRAVESGASGDATDGSGLESLRREIAELETEWKEHGHKLEIEGSPPLMASAPTESFYVKWEKWRSSLMEGLDFLTDGHQNRYVPTCYTPSNIVDSPSWVSIELDQTDIESVLSDANPALSTRFGLTADNASALTNIRFEATSVDLVRSWLPKDLFTSRFWRFPDPARTIDWPGYVTGLVLLRNIELLSEKEIEASPDNLVGGNQRPGTFSRGIDPIRQRRNRRIAMAFGLALSVLLSIAFGGNPYIPHVIAAPAGAALFYLLYRLFEIAMRRRLFRTSKIVSWLGWIVFIAFAVTLVVGLLGFNVFYGNVEAGVGMVECPKPPSGASFGDHVGSFFGCLILELLVILLLFGLLILVVAVAAVVLLIVGIFTRYQPIRRSTRYFRRNYEPAMFDRMTDEPEKTTQIDADRYPTRIFIAGLRTRPLGRVPNPDPSLEW